MKPAPFKVKKCKINLLNPTGHGYLRVFLLVSYLKKKNHHMLNFFNFNGDEPGLN